MQRNSNWRYVLRFAIATLLAVAAAGFARAQEAAAAPATLFTSDEPLRLRLEAPFAAITRARAEREEIAAKLVYSDGNGEVALDLEVRVRGKSRAAVCGFPPLLLNFPAKSLTGTVFAGENKLKLVTHCMPETAYEQYVQIEYLAYRVFNLLTDSSLRVRPVEVSYYDTERGRTITTKPAFLIEDEENFAAQHGLAIVAEPRVERARYNSAELGLVEMFQYFLGNTDWSALAGPADSACCHNVVPFARADGTLLPVPYDFDASGLVNPPHALPAQGLGIRTVRTRVYRGPCRSVAELQASFEPFQRNRAAIEALFAGDTRVGRPWEMARNYVEEFYAVLTEPEKIERAFRSACRQ